jgi:hypothetical protein
MSVVGRRQTPRVGKSAPSSPYSGPRVTPPGVRGARASMSHVATFCHGPSRRLKDFRVVCIDKLQVVKLQWPTVLVRGTSFDVFILGFRTCARLHNFFKRPTLRPLPLSPLPPEIDVYNSQTRFPRSLRRLAASPGSAVTCARTQRGSPFTTLLERSFVADSFFIADYSSRHLCRRNSTPTAYQRRSTDRLQLAILRRHGPTLSCPRSLALTLGCNSVQPLLLYQPKVRKPSL